MVQWEESQMAYRLVLIHRRQYQREQTGNYPLSAQALKRVAR
jgi:uncharacterized protein (DUF2384 family)